MSPLAHSRCAYHVQQSHAYACRIFPSAPEPEADLRCTHSPRSCTNRLLFICPSARIHKGPERSLLASLQDTHHLHPVPVCSLTAAFRKADGALSGRSPVNQRCLPPGRRLGVASASAQGLLCRQNTGIMAVPQSTNEPDRWHHQRRSDDLQAREKRPGFSPLRYGQYM